MTDNKMTPQRDEVLFAFHRACDVPTVDQIIEWTERYPEFADDIREHAAIRREWAAHGEEPMAESDELLISRGRSRALNAIYNAQVAAAPAAAAASAHSTFDQLMNARSLTTPQLAREIDIERSVLADMVRGRMLPPITRRLLAAVTSALKITADEFHRALQHALASPTLGHAKADRQPTVVQRSCEDIIRSSSMPEDRRSYWLEGD